MTRTLTLAGLALAASTLAFAPSAVARQGADDPVGHVRQEDRQADRATEVRREDRRADRATEVRREDRRADRANEVRHGADDTQPHG